MKSSLFLATLSSLLNLSIQSFDVLPNIQPRAAAAAAGTSNSFAGSNLYFLHGLSGSEQDDYINTMASYGAKVLRIWVMPLSKGCQKGSNIAVDVPDFEDTIGTYNTSALEALDGVLAKMAAKGMKAIISPHDGNAVNPSDSRCDVYCKTYSTNGNAEPFYQSDAAKAQIDARYAAILNFPSPSSGKNWSQWSEAIMAFDVENEPLIAAQNLITQKDPSNWLCERAGNMSKIINGSGILIATGGIGGGDQSNLNGGNGANFLDKAIQCNAIDIMSIHGYISTADFWTSQLPKWLSAANAVQPNPKHVMVEEFGFCTNNSLCPGHVSSADANSFDKQAAAITAQSVPYTYWQMTPGPDDAQVNTDCWTGCCADVGNDGYEVAVHNTTNKGNVQTAIQTAVGQALAQGQPTWPL